MEAKPIFTIDLEEWSDAFHIDKGNHSSIGCFVSILSLLSKYNVKAIIYKLEYNSFSSKIHTVKSHGKYHRWWENADRRPYQWLGFTGGFWFRFLPFWVIKWQVKKQGLFYIHPHDLDEEHPKLKNPIMNWKRHVGLKSASAKLERLLNEVSFGNP